MKLLHLVGAFLAAPLLASAIPTPESLPVLYANLARRTPPNIPTTAEAKALLAACTVAPPGPQTGYSRSKFKTWDTINGTCNTRETVLVRDGTGVQVDSACRATSGTWVSPYDGATWTSASNLDIDHFIPLSNAWKSGAAAWTDKQREVFANDLVNPQLIAVTNVVNRAKGDKGPETWKPPIVSFYCTYAKMWAKVKNVYKLTINDAEKAALVSMLATC